MTSACCGGPGKDSTEESITLTKNDGAISISRSKEMSKFTPTLATTKSTPPTSSSYWVVPDLLLAGAYPGSPDTDEHRLKVEAIVGAGIRKFVNLMEPDEANYAGDSFVSYQDLARQLRPEIVCVRHQIRDGSIPTVQQMVGILDAIDASVTAGKPVYVHCWGGVGRTGTVVGCWLLRHGLAGPADVLKTLMRLRQQDQERPHRMSPETGEQARFVQQWRDTDGKTA